MEVTGTNSKVYEITDTDGSHAAEWLRVNYNNPTSLGVITGYRQGVEAETGRFGGSPELTLAGTWAGGFAILESIVRGLTAGSYTLFKAGAGFTMASRFKSNQNIDLPTGVSLLDFSPANFPNSSTLQLRDMILTRGGVFNAEDSNITPNITESDLPSSWRANQGMHNTFVGGRLVVSAEADTPNPGIDTPADVVGTFTGSFMEHFDQPSSGQLRNLGVDPRDFNLYFDLTLDANPDNELTIDVIRWHDSTSSFSNVASQRRPVNSLRGGRDVAFFNLLIPVTLDENDYLKLQVTNHSHNTVPSVVEQSSFFMAEAR